MEPGTLRTTGVLLAVLGAVLWFQGQVLGDDDLEFASYLLLILGLGMAVAGYRAKERHWEPWRVQAYLWFNIGLVVVLGVFWFIVRPRVV